MNFQNLIHLQGYGCYVWPAYGIVVFFLGLHLIFPWIRWRKLKDKRRAVHAQTQ